MLQRCRDDSPLHPLNGYNGGHFKFKSFKLNPLECGFVCFDFDRLAVFVVFVRFRTIESDSFTNPPPFYFLFPLTLFDDNFISESLKSIKSSIPIDPVFLFHFISIFFFSSSHPPRSRPFTNQMIPLGSDRVVSCNQAAVRYFGLHMQIGDMQMSCRQIRPVSALVCALKLLCWLYMARLGSGSALELL